MSAPTFSMSELVSAVRALHDGEFSPSDPEPAAPPDPDETPAVVETVDELVRVAGVCGGCGTTTVALAIAEAMSAQHLVEWALPEAAGLGEAPTAERGESDGWNRGIRDLGDPLWIHRRCEGDAVRDCEGLTVEDLGLVTAMPAQCRPAVVVAPCSVPGARKLHDVLDRFPEAVPVVVGGGRSIPRVVIGAMGPQARAAMQERRLIHVPELRELRVTGITGAPLPRLLRTAAENIINRLERPS